MTSGRAGSTWSRRARPLLGTLVEIGVRLPAGRDHPAFDAAFAEIHRLQACLSRFEAGSDVSRFHALRRGESFAIGGAMQAVLHAAAELRDASAGAFDISVGTSPQGWRCEGDRLHKLDDAVRLDLGGIAKGYAVDRAVQVLLDRGCAAGWVNAGGDLRSFGDVDVPVCLRDEASGGVRTFASLRDGAFATSHFGPSSRSRLARDGSCSAPVHASVAAPRCVWADALTKLVACSGDAAHPLLARYDATAWIH